MSDQKTSVVQELEAPRKGLVFRESEKFLDGFNMTVTHEIASHCNSHWQGRGFLEIERASALSHHFDDQATLAASETQALINCRRSHRARERMGARCRKRRLVWTMAGRRFPTERRDG